MVTKGAWAGALAIAPGGALYVGPAGDTAPHAHWAIQVALGMDGPVVLDAGGVGRHDGVVIGSGAPHALRAGPTILALVYVEPLSDLGAALAALLAGRAMVPLPAPARRALRAALDERALDAVTAALARALDVVPRPPSADTPRLRAALAAIEARLDGRVTLPSVAREVGLSASRLAALLRREIGMPLRAYVRWCRLRLALAEAARGASLTDAAHAAGFADAAHFTRTLRRAFGVVPSALVGPLTRGTARGAGPASPADSRGGRRSPGHRR
jgi:AraC-like DNA-binding protein